MSDCIFEIHQLWQSGFSRVYSNSCRRCSFEPEIIKIGQSSCKMCSNNIVNFEESTTILNAHPKTIWKLIVCTSYFFLFVSILFFDLPCQQSRLFGRFFYFYFWLWLGLVVWPRFSDLLVSQITKDHGSSYSIWRFHATRNYTNNPTINRTTIQRKQ